MNNILAIISHFSIPFLLAGLIGALIFLIAQPFSKRLAKDTAGSMIANLSLIFILGLSVVAIFAGVAGLALRPTLESGDGHDGDFPVFPIIASHEFQFAKADWQIDIDGVITASILIKHKGCDERHFSTIGSTIAVLVDRDENLLWVSPEYVGYPVRAGLLCGSFGKDDEFLDAFPDMDIWLKATELWVFVDGGEVTDPEPQPQPLFDDLADQWETYKQSGNYHRQPITKVITR